MSEPVSKEEQSTEDQTISRRDFLRAGLGLAGAGLVHFTILGSLGTPAHADPILNDNCEGCNDNNVTDQCDCYSGDAPNDQGKQRDVCTCGSDDGLQDLCTCGSEAASDHCVCLQEPQPGTPDKCDCPPEGTMVDSCECSGAGDWFQNSDTCACGEDRGSGTGSKDFCSCGDDSNESDTCRCDRDPSNPPGTGTDGADYCACPAENSTVDACTICSTDEHHHDQGNKDADVCTCGTEGQSADACLCWHDGWNEPASDACNCPTDKSGTVDSCACCAEPNQADSCNCRDDHSGSWCYEESANKTPPTSPNLADWCNCNVSLGDTGVTSAADECNCKTGDAWTNPCNEDRWNKQTDTCCYATSGKDPSIPPEPGVDVCECGADQANDWKATDYCRPGDGDKDYCQGCGTDKGVADVP